MENESNEGEAARRQTEEALIAANRQLSSRLDDIQGFNHVLERIATGGSLKDILERLVAHIERTYPDARASVLFLDPDRGVLFHGVAPRLSPDYVKAIDGLRVGHGMGACGTAAFRNEPVISGDTRTDPLWADYRRLAAAHRLRACWSFPIRSRAGQVLGTYAVYFEEPRLPTQEEITRLESAAHAASIAMEQDQERRGLEQARESLKESETRFRDLFDRAPVGYYECDAGGRIIRVNRTATAMLGHTQEEMLGRFACEFVVEKDTARRDTDVWLSGSEPAGTFERTWRRKDVSLMPAIVQYQTLRDAQGGITGLRATIQDVTTYKQLEDQFRHAQKMQTVGQLAGGVAHEFNNLLQVISGNSELLLDREEVRGPVAESIGEIRKAAFRAATLTRQLLAFSQKQIFSPKVFDLNEVVVRMNEMLRRAIGEDIELMMVTRPGLWRVNADPGQVEQVLMNLVVNARDAMPGGGRITVETANVHLGEGLPGRYIALGPGSYVMLAVSDTGFGMDEEVMSHLFEPFFTTKGPGGGVGLGLATIYGIVVQSGGGLDASSEPGQGAAFRVYLPRAEDAVEMAHPSESPSPWSCSS